MRVITAFRGPEGGITPTSPIGLNLCCTPRKSGPWGSFCFHRSTHSHLTGTISVVTNSRTGYLMPTELTRCKMLFVIITNIRIWCMGPHIVLLQENGREDSIGSSARQNRLGMKRRRARRPAAVRQH